MKQRAHARLFVDAARREARRKARRPRRDKCCPLYSAQRAHRCKLARDVLKRHEGDHPLVLALVKRMASLGYDERARAE
eukprot:scaffold68144_cov73-Phaeocystis_antarctica.AAC.6